MHTIDAFKWIVSLAWSRAFNFQDIGDTHFYALVPLAEMTNHENPKVELGNGAHSILEDDQYTEEFKVLLLLHEEQRDNENLPVMR